MTAKLVLVIALLPLMAAASGSSSSSMKFRPKAGMKMMNTENEKCESNETLKNCMDRINKMKMDGTK